MTSDVRAALEAGDDGFHEIQLNGKQLVFLGMATTLVSVVIFLCGVLVGRGVKPLDTVAQAAGPQAFDDAGDQPGRARRHRHAGPGATGDACPVGRRGTAVAAAAAAGPAGDTEPTPLGDEPDPSAPAPASDLAAARPSRLPSSRPPSNRRRRRSSRARPPSPSRRRSRRARPRPRRSPRRRSRRPPRPAVATAAPASAGGAIAVQVGAFATRKEADALAKKLSGRGYAVYVMNPTGDGKNVYRVRVGNYGTADEAQRVSARLTQQEKLKPWITR